MPKSPSVAVGFPRQYASASAAKPLTWLGVINPNDFGARCTARPRRIVSATRRLPTRECMSPIAAARSSTGARAR